MSTHDYYSSSPFHKHLDTNYAPCERELAQIDTFLHTPKRQLAEVSAQVVTAQRVLDELQAQKVALSKAIEAHEALKSPIRRLPREILQEIFLHCLPTDHLPTLDISEAPLLLTRVCRPWRALIQRTPALWSAVHIVVPGGSEKHRSFHQGRIERWLACSQSSPLTISLFCTDSELTSQTSEPLRHESFCAAILAHAFHIHTLTLEIPDRFLKAFTGTPHPKPDPTPWPLLQKVSLDRALNGEYGDPIVPIPHLELWKAPNLKYISWNAIWADFLSVETNWGQLEGIEVTGDDQSQYAYEFDGGPYCEFSAQEARRILAATPMLRTLKIALAQHDQMRGLGQGQLSTVSVPQPLVLQHLTKLDLVDTYIDPATKPTIFLEHLQLPALEHLTYDLFNSNIDNLNSSQPYPPADDPFLLRFIRAQKQPVRIKKLAISATAISRKGFLECLRRMPLLEQLWVTFGTLQARLNEDGEDITLLETEDERLKWDVRPDDEMLQAFMVDERARAERDQILCPKLHSIRLDRSICSLEAVKVLVDHRNRLSKLAAVPPCVPFRRLSFDLPVPRPIFVPRSARRLATCELEEELKEIGIDATLKLRDHNGLHRSPFQPYTAKSWHRYDPNDGLPQANSCYSQQLEEDGPWS